MGEQLEARKDEALTAVEEAIYGALKRADLLREVGPFLRQILALEALGAVLSVVRAESGQPSSAPSSPHETGLTAEQKARIEGIVDGVLVSFEQGKVAGRRLAKSRAALNGEGTE